MLVLQVRKSTINLGYLRHNMSDKSNHQMTKSQKFDILLRTANLGPKFMPAKSKLNRPDPFIIEKKQNL